MKREDQRTLAGDDQAAVVDGVGGCPRGRGHDGPSDLRGVLPGADATARDPLRSVLSLCAAPVQDPRLGADAVRQRLNL